MDSAYKRESLGMLDRLQGQIDIKDRPVQMPGMWKPDVQECTDGGVAEPRESLKGQEHLPLRKIVGLTLVNLAQLCPHDSADRGRRWNKQATGPP
jgi:hypothetical protein